MKKNIKLSTLNYPSSNNYCVLGMLYENKIYHSINIISYQTESTKWKFNVSDDFTEADEIIIQKLVNTKEYQEAKNIFTYLGKSPEIDTSIFIERAWKDGKNIAIPLCVDDKNMIAIKIKDFDDLEVGRFGIKEARYNEDLLMEKEDIDLIIVPCARADRHGNRLGFGRGYYDRYLEKTRAKTILLIREKQVAQKIPMGKHDKKIEKIITEKTVT